MSTYGRYSKSKRGKHWHQKQHKFAADGKCVPQPVSPVPDVPVMTLTFSVSQGLHFRDTAETDTLKRTLLGFIEVDRINYITSDPESVRQELKLLEPGLMSDVSEMFSGTIQNRVLQKEDDQGATSETKALKKSYFDVLMIANTRDRMGLTVLHHAVLNGDHELVKELLEKMDVRDLVDKFDRTALHMAALVDDSTMVTILADRFKNIDTEDMFGKTALYIAAENGNTRIVNYLMELGAQPDTVDMYGLSPLFAAIRGKFLVTVELLLSKDVYVDRQYKIGATPIHFAALNGDIKIVRVLLDKGAKANIVDKMENTPLMFAAKGGHLEVCLTLLEKYTVEDVRKASMDGIQAIHFAVQTGNVELVKTLIDRGADKNAKIEAGGTPLHVAVVFGNLPVVSYLVEKAKVNLDEVDQNMLTALDWAEGRRLGVTSSSPDIIECIARHGGHRSQELFAGTDRQSLDSDTTDLTSAITQTQHETEKAGLCSALSTSELAFPGLKVTDHPVLMPIMNLTDVKRMVTNLKKLLKDVGPEMLTQKNIMLSRRNFAMSVIGPKGGKITFADKSVTMTIPPDALSDTRVISCYRPIDLDDIDQGRQPQKDWVFYTPELICGPDGTKFNKPITIRFQHSVHVDRDGSCKGKSVRVITRGDSEEKWQEEDGDIEFDGRWADFKITHFTSIRFGAPAVEAPHHDFLISTGLTVPTEPSEGAQTLRTPTHLHVFITHNVDSHMEDLQLGRLLTSSNEVSSCADILESINSALELLIEGHQRTFKFIRDDTIIAVPLPQGMEKFFTSDDVPIFRTHRFGEDDEMLSLELTQKGMSKDRKNPIEHRVMRSNHSSVMPKGIYKSGSPVWELECRRQMALSRKRGRTMVPYPIQQPESVIPSILRQEQPQQPVELPEELRDPLAAFLAELFVTVEEHVDDIDDGAAAAQP